MDINIKHAEFQLGFHNSVRVLDAIGSKIACCDGHVWITQERDSRDIVLGAGDTFTLDRAGLTIIQALDTARIELCEPQSRVQGTPCPDASGRWRVRVRPTYHVDMA